MQPIKTDETNLVIAEHQDGVRPLPVYNTGKEIVAVWEVTEEEIESLKETKKIYLTISNFGLPIFPHLLTIENPLEDIGEEIGEICGRDGCDGIMVDARDGSCECQTFHQTPLCSHCLTTSTICSKCYESHFHKA